MTIEDGMIVRAAIASNEYRSLDSLFCRKDADAAREQKAIFALLGWGNVLMLLIAMLSALILARPTLQAVIAADNKAGWLHTAETVLAVVVAALTVATTALAQFARDSERLSRWQKLRAEAELARVARFKAVARTAAALGPAAAHEALGYITRELLVEQRDYYLQRATRHRASARLSTAWTVVATLLGALASTAAFSIAFGAATEWTMLAGVLAAAVGAFAADREKLHRDTANAELYERTAEKLNVLAAGTDSVASQIEQGSPEAVVTFTDLLAEELQAEHRQWLAGLEATGELLARLEQRLHDQKAGQPAAAVAVLADVVREKALRPAQVAGLATGVSALASSPLASALFASPMPGSPSPASSPSVRAASATLSQCGPVLGAAASALPSPYGEQAQALLTEVRAAVAQLETGGPAGSEAVATTALARRVRENNPVKEWIAGMEPILAPLLGPAMSPRSLLLGMAGIAARLDEPAYQRWTARLLGTPVPAKLLDINALSSAGVSAALEAAPAFAAAFAAERSQGDSAIVREAVGLAIARADQLWANQAERFGHDRGRFETAVRQVKEGLLAVATNADLAAIPAGTLPEGLQAREIRDAALAVRTTAEGVESVQTMIQLIHEQRAAKVADPATALQTLTAAGASA